MTFLDVVSLKELARYGTLVIFEGRNYMLMIFTLFEKNQLGTLYLSLMQ